MALSLPRPFRVPPRRRRSPPPRKLRSIVRRSCVTFRDSTRNRRIEIDISTNLEYPRFVTSFDRRLKLKYRLSFALTKKKPFAMKSCMSAFGVPNKYLAIVGPKHSLRDDEDIRVQRLDVAWIV
ncbi:hypothetical protein EVAR_757_1 [Eumeta japonica]|uniref:Uncharacterized protein n=1 Tax=Eumeta variegata TaxID=151549 RepID=A0A4C1SC13_EUMVA|nr:hypothetical protein EVAR_757_1 [Eumeta japonica]